MNNDFNNYYSNIAKMLKYFDKNHPAYANKHMLEIKLDTLYDFQRIKPRYAYVFNLAGQQEIKDEIDSLGLDTEGYRAHYDFRENANNFLDKYNINKKINIESNWRGRLFNVTDFMKANNKKNFLMKSYWRIIVVKDNNNNFYTRHDIYPVFWSPGFSVAGEKDFKESVANILGQLGHQMDYSMDTQYDYLKVFAMNQAKIKQLQVVKISNKDELKITKDFNFNSYKDEIIKNLNEYFKI